MLPKSKMKNVEMDQGEKMEPVDESELQMRRLNAKLDAIFDRILKGE